MVEKESTRRTEKASKRREKEKGSARVRERERARHRETETESRRKRGGLGGLWFSMRRPPPLGFVWGGGRRWRRCKGAAPPRCLASVSRRFCAHRRRPFATLISYNFYNEMGLLFRIGRRSTDLASSPSTPDEIRGMGWEASRCKLSKLWLDPAMLPSPSTVRSSCFLPLSVAALGGAACCSPPPCLVSLPP